MRPTSTNTHSVRFTDDQPTEKKNLAGGEKPGPTPERKAARRAPSDEGITARVSKHRKDRTQATKAPARARNDNSIDTVPTRKQRAKAAETLKSSIREKKAPARTNALPPARLEATTIEADDVPHALVQGSKLDAGSVLQDLIKEVERMPHDLNSSTALALPVEEERLPAESSLKDLATVALTHSPGNAGVAQVEPKKINLSRRKPEEKYRSFSPSERYEPNAKPMEEPRGNKPPATRRTDKKPNVKMQRLASASKLLTKVKLRKTDPTATEVIKKDKAATTKNTGLATKLFKKPREAAVVPLSVSQNVDANANPIRQFASSIPYNFNSGAESFQFAVDTLQGKKGVEAAAAFRDFLLNKALVGELVDYIDTMIRIENERDQIPFDELSARAIHSTYMRTENSSGLLQLNITGKMLDIGDAALNSGPGEYWSFLQKQINPYLGNLLAGPYLDFAAKFAN